MQQHLMEPMAARIRARRPCVCLRWIVTAATTTTDLKLKQCCRVRFAPAHVRLCVHVCAFVCLCLCGFFLCIAGMCLFYLFLPTSARSEAGSASTLVLRAKQSQTANGWARVRESGTGCWYWYAMRVCKGTCMNEILSVLKGSEQLAFISGTDC